MLDWFVKQFPEYVKMMKNCDYHYDSNNLNEHHLEGDVWSHTMLSYDIGILNKVSLYVLWALLLHDIGRVLTRSEDNNETTVNFGYYEGVSCFVSLEILNKTDLSEKQKSRILKIISYQYTIIDHIRYDDPPQDELIEMFLYEEDTLKDLADYVKCDISGRIVSKSLSQHYSVEKAQKLIDSLNLIESKNKVQVTKNNIIYLLVGPPCSRKSSWIKKQVNNLFIINRDACVEQVGKRHGKNSYNSSYRLMQENDAIKKEVNSIYNNLVEFTKNSKNMDIIIDNPNLKLKNRKYWMEALQNTHKIKIILFLNSYKDLKNCNNARLITMDKSVSEKGLKNKLMTFTYPLLNEGFDEIETIFI